MKYLILVVLYALGILAGSRIQRMHIGRIAGWVLYGLGCAFVIALGLIEYWKLGYQGDGFHYFSALRSFVDGHGVYEGPTFEYLLGNHSYLTLLVFAPLVAIIRDPAILLIAMTGSHLIAALLVYRLAAKLISTSSSPPLVPFVLGALYLMYPTVFGVLYGRQLFQPDYLLAPLLLVLLHGLVDGRARLVSWCIVLIVLTKEEYIVTLPVMMTWALAGTWWILGRRELMRRDVILMWIGLYVAASAVALAVYVHQRSINTLDYAIRNIVQIDRLLLPSSWRFMFEEMIVWGAPLLPLLVLLLVRRGRVAIPAYGALSLIAFLPGRSLGNMLIYGGHWWFQYATWSDAVIAPVVFGTVIIAWNAAGVAAVASRTQYLALLVSLLLSFHFSFYPELNTPWQFLNRVRSGAARGPYAKRGELEQIRDRLIRGTDIGPRDYAIIPDYTEALVVPHMSHVRLAWWIKTDPPVWRSLVEEARLVVVPKGHDWFDQVPRQIEAYHQLLLETEHYLVFGPPRDMLDPS